MNVLPVEQRASVVSLLCEGNPIRSIERVTGIHRDTIMRLGIRMGDGCKRNMDEKLRKLNCRIIEIDEIWGVVGMKAKTAKRAGADGTVGDVWT